MSIGRANIPTPPNNTTKIHPKNDKIAITYTASELSNYNVASTMEDLPGSLNWLTAIVTYLYGKSTYLKNAQEIKSINTEITIAPPVKHKAFSNRLHIGSSSSVSYRKIE